MLSADIREERFYGDALAILSNWQGVLLRIQLFLIFKNWIPSAIFYAIVQLCFWIPVFLQLNKAFIAMTLISMALFLDLGKNWLWPKSELFRLTGYHAAEEVKLALQNREIYSVQELSYYFAKGFRLYFSIINIFAPYRHKHSILFLVLSCILSLALIWVGALVECQLTYILFNIVLILPALFHHRVFSKLWSYMEPFINKIEAEFDRGQLETNAEREAEEKELWKPMVSSVFFRNAEETSEILHGYGAGGPDSYFDDAESSESQFIHSLLPQNMQQSTEKNRRALDTMTREILKTCKNQKEIDNWFSEAINDPRDVSKTENTENSRKNPGSTAINKKNVTCNSDFDAWDDFSTDDEFDTETFVKQS